MQWRHSYVGKCIGYRHVLQSQSHSLQVHTPHTYRYIRMYYCIVHITCLPGMHICLQYALCTIEIQQHKSMCRMYVRMQHVTDCVCVTYVCHYCYCTDVHMYVCMYVLVCVGTYVCMYVLVCVGTYVPLSQYGLFTLSLWQQGSPPWSCRG